MCFLQIFGTKTKAQKFKKKATFWKYRIQWNRNMHNCVLHLNIYYKLTN